jgi:tetratricopeptide (TPR) repeat protein
MRQYTLNVFQQTADSFKLRLFDSEKKLLDQRDLQITDIQQFISAVESDYKTRASDQLDLQKRLVSLGGKLYEWVDGPANRWLSQARKGAEGLAIHIDVSESLRHLPWELLFADGNFLCNNAAYPFTPVRMVDRDRSHPFVIQNRPLRILFMACSPENAQPYLDFETEEKKILEATDDQSIELRVEESGSLEGLGFEIGSFGKDYFDVFHLTGHAEARDGKPVFLMEDEFGMKKSVTAEDLTKSFSNIWPRLIFLSGCETAKSTEQGNLPSLCEALVRAGAPAVLGWALPVGDIAASNAAAKLYKELSHGKRVDEAVALARQELIEHGSIYWHLLRLYTNATSLAEQVTELNHPNREMRLVRPASSELIDVGAKREVCRREDFVGRRRMIQRCLRRLKTTNQTKPEYAEGLLLHGTGGLGKSSLGIRLCERLPDHKRIFFVGCIDLTGFINTLCDKLNSKEANQLLNDTDLTLTQRLRLLFKTILNNEKYIFFFDDFEYSLDESDSSGYKLQDKAATVLNALLTAIREAPSASRVIITCRYQFPMTGKYRLYEEGLGSLTGADLNKKLARLDEVYQPEDEELRVQAIKLGAGNPRLLERLYKVLADSQTDQQAILDALEQTTAEMREDILLKKLLEQQGVAGRRIVALTAIYDMAVDRTSVEAVTGESFNEAHLERAIALSLVEEGKDTTTQESRYYVSSLLHPMLEGVLTEDEQMEACSRAAQHLYRTLWVEKKADLEQALEIYRLAVLARVKVIAVEIADRVSNMFVNTARYVQAEQLCNSTLVLGDDYRIFHNLARAEQVLGKTAKAIEHYEKALAQCPEVNPQEEPEIAKEFAAIVNNLATLLMQQGDVKRAMELYQQSLDIHDQIGNAQGKAATLHAMASVYVQQGDVKRAMELYQQSLDIKEQIGNAQGKAATLHQMASVYVQQGDVKRAMELYQQSLDIEDQIGDARGKAATLHAMASVYVQQGDVKRAMELYQQSLDIKEQIGNTQGKAATLHQMASVYVQQGDVKRAMELYQQSLDIEDQIGNARGKAATLHEMASVYVQQGDVKRAMELYQQSLDIHDQIGNAQGKAATLHQMASAYVQQGDVKRAMELYQQSLDIEDQIGNARGKAVTLANMAYLAGQQGDRQRERELNEEAARALASTQAWVDLTTVLSNLGMSEDSDALQFWAQAFWLCLRVGVPIEDAVNLAVALFQQLGAENETIPLVAASAIILTHIRGANHPQKDAFLQAGFSMLAACAQARGVDMEKIQEWVEKEALLDPAQVFPKLNAALEALVGGDNWLFDRQMLS